MPTLALIAHDGKKDAIIAFCRKHAKALKKLTLIGTGTTGSRIAEATGAKIERVLSGPLGGDAQIAARVAVGQVQAVIFLTDPLSAHPHDPDIQGLMRVCNVHNVPLATNIATAEMVIAGMGKSRV